MIDRRRNRGGYSDADVAAINRAVVDLRETLGRDKYARDVYFLVGKHRRISAEARARWRRQREAEVKHGRAA
jgi:hypothetical protein